MRREGTMTHPTWPRITQAIHEAETIAISGHVNPDGDCLGSILGLGLTLESLGKKVDMVHNERPSHLAYLPGFDRLQALNPNKSYDLFVMVDLGDRDRLKESAALLDRAKMTVNFDHHQVNEGVCDLVCQVKDASSTCELLGAYLIDQGFSIPAPAATALFAGITTDSNRFMYDTARARCLRLAADLIDRGADPGLVYLHEYQSVDPRLFAFKGALVDRASFLCEGKVVLATVSQEDLTHYSITMGEAEGVVDVLRNLDGVEVACLVKEMGEKSSKFSFRSKRFFNVEEVARSFGGGGHIKAAGASVSLPKDQAFDQVKAYFEGLDPTALLAPGEEG